MDFLELISHLTTDTEIVGTPNGEALSYINIGKITVNNTEYSNPLRVCLMNTDTGIKLYISQYNAKKITGFAIADIETLEVV